MRLAHTALLAASLLLWSTGAQAEEKGLIIRAGDLMAQPFIDAARTSALTANQPVTIIERRGGWARVESNGLNGWVRLLNVRLEPNAANASPRTGGSNPLSLLRTGSSGQTVTTGVKGMDEEQIRNATVNYAELERLNALGVAAAEAGANARTNNLKENKVDYLAKGRGK